ncbi:NAIP [Mytilus coruscus]|uniref:NAIP n=1 Tax=Mytilus coruscus TaxID=42192 RepID=A0A6J8F170_MYTCO|nr:NAIP [Mytilus coruscus]
MKSNFVLVRLAVFWFLLLDIPVSLTTIPICLTWNTKGNYLFVECMIYNATSVSEIFIVDPYGRNRLPCSTMDFPGCDERHQNDLNYADVSDYITTWTIKTPKKGAEGEWKCRHGHEEKHCTMSTIDIELSGEISKTKEEHVFKLECFSCRKPYIEGVDIYVNGVLEDSIRHRYGLCYHKKTSCYPEKCTCLSGGRHFTWNFNSDLSYIQFTCAMHFKEKTNSAITIHKASLIYNGTAIDEDEQSRSEILPLQEKELDDDCPRCNGSTNQDRDVMCYRNIFNKRLAETCLDNLKIYSNAFDHLKQFGLELLKCWGVEVEKDRVSFHMNKLQSLGCRHHIFIHDVTACFFRGRSFQFLRLYDVMKFELSHLKLHKNMYDELNKIFKMITDTKGEKWWYHYRRNGLNCKGASQEAFNLVFLNEKRFVIFEQFQSIESRLSTFQEYPIENKSYRKKLALAGFFYNHVSDYVQCFECGGCLRAWKSMSDPMIRHQTTFKTCQFACHTKWKESSTMDVEPATYDSMHTLEDRLNSFKSFPDTHSRDDLKQLAHAGFYYYGIAEDIVCAACNIGFASVENSEYIVRLHKKYSRKCPFIHKSKNHAMKSRSFESIDNFVPFLEIERRQHDF